MKYTFVEFIAALDSKDFDKIEESWLNWAKTQFLPSFQKDFVSGKHEGDCTKQSFTCSLCCLEQLLTDYKEYYFNEEQWRKDNLI